MSKFKETFTSRVIAIGFLAFIGLGFWNACFRVNNEIGPIGADKDGRQIMLQSIDAYLSRGNSISDGFAVNVTSEFHSQSFLWRMLQEPMLTTFRLEYRILDPGREIDGAIGRSFLSTPAEEFLGLYRGPISLHEDWEISPDSLLATLAENNVHSVADVLSAFGFTTFEVLVDGVLVVEEALPSIGTGNVKWVGD